MSRNTKASASKSKMGEATLKRHKLAAAKNNAEGEAPDEVVSHFSTIPNKNNMYDSLSSHARIQADGFIKNFEKNIRAPIPIHEKRRAKLDKDEDYLPAQYVKLENSEYVLIQAPDKQNHRDLWRLVWQDQIIVMVCICTEDQMSNSDDKKCYPYFPTESGQTLDVEMKKGKLIINCKGKEQMAGQFVRYDFEVTGSDLDEEKKEDEAAGAGKMLAVTFFHVTGWQQKPENAKEPFEYAHSISMLSKEVFKAEMNVLRRSMENFVPPVLIQSQDAIGRAGVLWVVLMLIKDVEKRECFDVPELMKKLMKMRPGSISSYYHFCLTFAASFFIAKEANWINEAECTSKINELTKGYLERKLNDNGVPI